nr:vegetative cell wall protein gp1-like [Lolium perenne]
MPPPSPAGCPPPAYINPRPHHSSPSHLTPHPPPPPQSLPESAQGAALGCRSPQPPPSGNAAGSKKARRTPPHQALLPDAVTGEVLPDARKKEKAPPARSATTPTTLDLAAMSQTSPPPPAWAAPTSPACCWPAPAWAAPRLGPPQPTPRLATSRSPRPSLARLLLLLARASVAEAR